MKPVRFNFDQICAVKMGKLSTFIRPAQKLTDHSFNDNRLKWFWVKEQFLVVNDQVVYFPDDRFTDDEFRSDLRMPIEYSRLFIQVEMVCSCRLFSVDNQTLSLFGFHDRKSFNRYWKDIYGIINFSGNPMVSVYHIKQVEQSSFETFITNHFSNAKCIL